MDAGGFNWSLMNILGPLLLVLALLWLVLRRKSKGRDAEYTERKTHDLYEEEERRRREGTDEL